MVSDEIGFVGLGNMGRPMATNLVNSGRAVVVHDAAGTQARGAPRSEARSLEHRARGHGRGDSPLRAGRPGVGVDRARDRRCARSQGRGWSSTTPPSGPRRPSAVHALLAGHGVEYVDAPVSGGVSGAVDATLAIMYSGSETTFETLRPVFESMAGNVFRVGSAPGQGQAMKVLNNFLSGTAMAATAEAVAFGGPAGPGT